MTGLRHPDYPTLLEAIDEFGRETLLPLLAAGAVKAKFLNRNTGRFSSAVEWRARQMFLRDGGVDVVEAGQTSMGEVIYVWRWEVRRALARAALDSKPRPTLVMVDNVTDMQKPSTVADEKRCQKWLQEQMALTPANNPRPKSLWEKEASELFKVSGRGFDRAWANAIVATGAEAWGKAGAKSKQ
ncbi:hypothetical protein [Mesorhizobium sp. M0847]|uniref:hypothetical protein n=1 Tax=unclassified Mesorhizobium TaxID=325217 RepID=UPI00333BAA3E